MLDLAILGLLQEREFHGYEIRKRLRDDLGLFANISFGSLYPALARLEAAGAVVSSELPGPGRRSAEPVPATGSLGGELAAFRSRRDGTPRGTKRARKVYRITDLGRKQFEELLASDEPAGTDDARSFGLRLAFARHLAPPARLGLLERRRAQLAGRLAADRARVEAGSAFDSYTRSLVEHSTETTEHDISWLDRLIESERLEQQQQQQTGPVVRPDDTRPRRRDGEDHTVKGTVP
jgi:DNA-binding PadR family transcriptional regulator